MDRNSRDSRSKEGERGERSHRNKLNDDADEHQKRRRHDDDRRDHHGSRSNGRSTTKSRKRYSSRSRSRDRRHTSKNRDQHRGHSRRGRSFENDRNDKIHNEKKSRSRSTSQHRQKRRSHESSKHNRRQRSRIRESEAIKSPKVIVITREESTLGGRRTRANTNDSSDDALQYNSQQNEKSTKHRDRKPDFMPRYESEKIKIPDNLDDPIDKEKIHKEIEEKLRETLAREGKVYPPPKPEASHPIFANDGSFLETFKRMQEQMQATQQNAGGSSTSNNSLSKSVGAAAAASSVAPISKRRGLKILKTGIVAKPKLDMNTSGDPKDVWALYLQEVKKYKNSACDNDTQTRSLVK